MHHLAVDVDVVVLHIHSNMSAPMASWFQAAFDAHRSQPRVPARTKTALSKTWLGLRRQSTSWHKPASWMESLSMCDRFWRSARGRCSAHRPPRSHVRREVARA